MNEEGWKFVHAVSGDNGVSTEKDWAGIGFQIALAGFVTVIEKKYRASIEAIKEEAAGR